jgi:hypothetical protein
MRIAAFDMGIRNFAFCIEDISIDKIPKKVKKTYDEDGCPIGDYKKYVEKVYTVGNLVECQKWDIQEYCSEKNIDNIYLCLTVILNKFSKLWDTVDVFLIEQQMAYGNNKSNIQALRLSQHCLSYFYVIYGPFKIIQEFSSSHKTRILGCPYKDRKKHLNRKKFAINLATQILKERKDEQIIKFTKLSKKDDVSDCILMIQSYKILYI